VNGITRNDVQRMIMNRGYAKEEFAWFNGKQIRREEYDDGSTIIKGKPTRLTGAQLEYRILSRYNFIVAPHANCASCELRLMRIAPHASPLNTMGFDRYLEDTLNSILRGVSKLEDSLDTFIKLPRQDLR
jgi:hypothetical protein